MSDPILESWLADQQAAAFGLAERSSLLEVCGLGSEPYSMYEVGLDCRGLILGSNGEIVEHQGFHLALHFHSNYLRQAEPMRVCLVAEPVWHPNVRAPLVCPGAIRAGTTFVELVRKFHSVVTWNHLNLLDPLNEAACEFARTSWDGRPIDERPLFGTQPEIQLTRRG